jgi:hypothetical protein
MVYAIRFLSINGLKHKEIEIVVKVEVAIRGKNFGLQGV